LSAKPIVSLNYHVTNVVQFKATMQCCDYLYCVCWSNDAGLNGFLAEILGGSTIYSKKHDWEVFATGLDFDSASPRPSRDLVLAQIKIADCGKLWKAPFEGPKNTGQSRTNPFVTKPGISANANFIWNWAGTGTPAYPLPFSGSNQGEFLIFRLSAKKLYRECVQCECDCCDCCDCGCGGCNEHAAEQEKTLSKRAQDKSRIIPSTTNAAAQCPSHPYTALDCRPALGAQQLNLCFYLNLLDGPSDQVETHDMEVFYLTVCNNYSDLEFKGLRITKLTIVPTSPVSQIQLVPDSFICFDCLSPCSCKSRELALITRDVPAGSYRIEAEYCVDEIVVKKEVKGTASFPITVVKD
jgi:hypothetical protein